MSTKNIIPNRWEARVNGLISAVVDVDWLNIRGVQFDPHANPDALETDLTYAIEHNLHSKDAKEILTADRDDGLDRIHEWWSLAQSLYSQALIRALAPAHCGAIDALGTTTEDVFYTPDWDDIINQFAQEPAYPGLLELIRVMNPVIWTAMPQPSRKYRGGQALLFCPHKTAAECWTALGNLQTYSEAGNYYEKTKIPLTQFNGFPDPLEIEVMHMRSTPYGHALSLLAWLPLRSNDNTGVFHISSDNYMVATKILDANLLTDVFTAATWVSGVVMTAPPGQPFSDLYGLVRYAVPYDATHNTRGSTALMNNASLGTTMAPDQYYAAQISHSGTTFTIAPYTTYAWFQICWQSLLNDSVGMTLVKDLGDQTVGPDASFVVPMEYVAMSNDWINNIEVNFMEKVMRNAGLYSGFDSVTPIKPGPSDKGKGSNRKRGRKRGKGKNRSDDSKT